MCCAMNDSQYTQKQHLHSTTASQAAEDGTLNSFCFWRTFWAFRLQGFHFAEKVFHFEKDEKHQNNPDITSFSKVGSLLLFSCKNVLYLDKTIATASFKTLSPKIKQYSKESTLSSVNIANTVTGKRNKRKLLVLVKKAKNKEWNQISLIFL